MNQPAASSGLGGLLGGAALGAAGNLVGGAIDSIFNKVSIKDQVAAQKELTDYNSQRQYQQQLKLWENTNYPQQVKMLKEAGLNPALLYKGGAGGGATTGAGAPTQSVNSHINSSGSGISMMALQGAMLQAQIQNIKADTEQKLSTVPANKNQPNVQASQITANQGAAALSNANAELSKTNNQLEQLNLSYKTETYDKSIEQFNNLANTTTEQLQQMKNNTAVSNETIQTKIEQQIANLAETYINIQSKKAGIQLTNKQVWQISNSVAQNWQYVTQGATDVQTRQAGQRTNEQNASTYHTSIDQGWENIGQTIKKLGLEERQTSVIENRSFWQNFKDATSSIKDIVK